MSRRAGVTLLELMVVTAIIAVVLGIGTAFFTGMARTYRLRATADQVAGVVRSGSAHAAWVGQPARIDLDVAAGTVRSIGPRPVGQWHFDDGTGAGAFGRDALIGGGAWPAPGRVGGGLEFGAGGSVDCGEAGRYSLFEGVAIEAWIRPTALRDMVVVDVGGGATLGVSRDLELVGLAGGIGVQTERDAIPLGRWTLVGLLHDGKTLTLSIDHVERARARAESRWKGDPTARVTISDSRRPFAGTIDEVRIDSVLTLESLELGPKMTFESVPGQGTLRFDRRGRLEETVHGEEESIVLYSENRRERRAIRVARSGSVRVEEKVEAQR